MGVAVKSASRWRGEWDRSVDLRFSWVAATSIALSAYGERSTYLTSGFCEMGGDAGSSVEIVRFEVPDVGARASVEQIAHGCGLSMSDLFVDLRLLNRWDYLENIGATSYRITDHGRRYYRGADYEDII